jgi:MFS family permease
MTISQTWNDRIALAAVCLSSLMFGLEISSVPVILPTLETVLNGNFSEIQWIMNAYTIACTTVLMATGTLADRFGRKRVFCIAILLFGITSLLCGIGLGLTNTPVTNTTTGSVPSTRSGMASGIDMSARLISLAVNIAFMGFVLVSGILAYLKGALPGLLQPQLHSLAEKIAAGDVGLLDHTFPGATEGTAHAALVHGFGMVMLYGGVGVWILAATSFITFRARKPTYSQPDQDDAQTESGCRLYN